MKLQPRRNAKKTPARLLAALMITSLIFSMLPVAALAAAANSDSFKRSSIPLAMSAGQRCTISITVKNTGSATWTAAGGFRLVAVGGSDPLASATSYPLSPSDKIKPNGSKVFTIVMTAPLKAGTLQTDWQMAKGSANFGPVLSKYVKVSFSANNSRFVSAIVPKRMNAMTTARVKITFKNTGKDKWTSKGGYKLVAVGMDNDEFDYPGVYPLDAADSIAMGGNKTFLVELNAPAPMGDDMDIGGDISLSPQNYTLKWQLYAGKTKFGEVCTVTVQVYYTEAQKLSIATEIVEAAESTNMQEMLDEAQNIVNQLANGPDKTALQKRIDNEQQIIAAIGDYTKIATTAKLDVETAETSHKQLDVNVARQLVAKLSDGALKNSLTARLDAVQTIIDLAGAKSAVALAEGSKLQADVDAARALVNALPAGADKNSMGTRLDAVQAILNAAATDAVVKAEGSKLQADVDAARALVDALPAGAIRSDLETRLNAVQAI